MSELDGKYVNEQNHKKMKNIFIYVGIALIVVAVILIIIGSLLISKGTKLLNTDMESSTWFEDSSSGGRFIVFGTFILGLALMLVVSSIVLFLKAHTRELASFKVSSVAPVATDAIKYANKELLPETKNTIETIANGISKAKNNEKACPSCGKENKKSNKFCAYCGAEMEKHLRCTQCGAELEQDTSFCPSCGKKIEK